MPLGYCRNRRWCVVRAISHQVEKKSRQLHTTTLFNFYKFHQSCTDSFFSPPSNAPRTGTNFVSTAKKSTRTILTRRPLDVVACSQECIRGRVLRTIPSHLTPVPTIPTPPLQTRWFTLIQVRVSGPERRARLRPWRSFAIPSRLCHTHEDGTSQASNTHIQHAECIIH